MTDKDPISEGFDFFDRLKMLGKAFDEGGGPAVAATLGLFDPELSELAKKASGVVAPHLKLKDEGRAKLYGRIFGASKGFLEVLIKRIPNEMIAALLEKGIDFGDFLFVHIVDEAKGNLETVLDEQRARVLDSSELNPEQKDEVAKALDDFYGELGAALTEAKQAPASKPKIDRTKLRADIKQLSGELKEVAASIGARLPEIVNEMLRGWAWLTGSDPDEMMETDRILTEARRTKIARRELKWRRKAEARLAKEQAKLEKAKRKY
ncbi:MAG: hypothetical protein WD883_01165 [Candidatus Colwellbacteria bacterium]